FVGPPPIAKYIYETGARNGKRVQALGGAKNHAVVLPDADLSFATEAIIGRSEEHPSSLLPYTTLFPSIYEAGARNGKRVQALGGAKNHAVVLPDADLSFATEAIIGAGYGSAGERCMAISAIVAVGEVADPLVARPAERPRRGAVGGGPRGGGAADDKEGGVVMWGAKKGIKGGFVGGGEEGAQQVVDGRNPG